jgi:hypothetical protein
MPRSALHTIAGLLAVVAALLVPLPARAQPIVLSARSLDSVLADSRYIAWSLTLRLFHSPS